MRWVVCFLLVAVGGCVESSDPELVSPPFGEMPLTWYVPTYPGSHTAPEGEAHQWLAIIHNPTDEPVEYGIGQAPWHGPFGPMRTSGWANQDPEDLHMGDGMYVTQRDVLQPDQSRIWGFTAPVGAVGTLATALVAFDGGEVVAGRNIQYTVNEGPATTGVQPGDHVLTATVGLWLNGTSFYTNIEALNDDPRFPAGYDRTAFDGTPLPIYVYEEDRTEQPAGSRDTCHFTTITGYNALVKTQNVGGTGFRFLAPEEGYTVAGAEDHFLYGEPLIFVNTIVGYEGATGPADLLPQPQGACFDAQNTVDFVTEQVPA